MQQAQAACGPVPSRLRGSVREGERGQPPLRRSEPQGAKAGTGYPPMASRRKTLARYAPYDLKGEGAVRHRIED